MANKKNKTTEDTTLDLTEPMPEGLPQAESASPSDVPAVRTGASLIPAAGSVPMLSMEGVRPPYLSLVHGTSKELIEHYNAGDIVLDKSFLAAAKGERLQAIFLNVYEHMRERLDQDAWAEGLRPRSFANKEEAVAAGLNMEWGAKGSGIRPEASLALDITALIRKPADRASGLYGVPIDGITEEDGSPAEWGIAMLSIDKTCARVFKGDITLVVNNKIRQTGVYHSALWELNSELAPASPNSTNRPFIVRARFKSMLEQSAIDSISASMQIPVSTRDDGED